jgi:multidrug efflux pump subunit AcrA (membrane-fusion protein)
MHNHEKQPFHFGGLCLIGLWGLLAHNVAVAADAPAAAPAVQTIAVPASIEAYWSADLYAKTSGYVTDVKFDLGDHVTKGIPLAILHVPELEKNLAQAKATLEAKKQMLKAADAVIAQSKQSLIVAQKQFESYKVDMEYQQITLKRQQELSAGSAITPQQLDEARSKAELAKASMGIGEAKISAAQADIQFAEASRAVAASQVDVASAAVDEVQTLLGYTQITAPFDGIIIRRQINIGDLVQSVTASRGASMFTVQQIETVRVFCDVPELKAAGVSAGDRADVKVYGLDGQTIAGKVTRVATSLNAATRTMRVEIDLKNPGEALRPGMYAQVTLTPHVPIHSPEAALK